MLDLITIGDIKLDVFMSLETCADKCDMVKGNLTLEFGEKIVAQVQDQQIAGSAPNVAVALARMGHNTAVMSNMGDDFTYPMAKEFLKKEGVNSTLVKSHKHTQSAYAAVLNLQGEKTILASYIKKKYTPPTRKSKWLFISEMGSGYTTLFNGLAKSIKKSKTILAFNPGNAQIQERKPALLTLIKATNVLFVNVQEGQRILQNQRLGILSIAQGLHTLGPQEVIITDGRNGAYGYDGETLIYCPLYPGPRVEATGAGDSFAAAYIGARMRDLPMATAMQWGAVNAAEVVLHIGPTKGLLRHTQIISRINKAKSFKTEVVS